MITTLERIAEEMALLKGEGEQHKIKYLMYARNGVTELNVHILRNKISVKIDIKDNMCAVLPDDFTKLIKIGLCINNHIIELDRDKSICTNDKDIDFCKEDGSIMSKDEVFNCVTCSITEKENIPKFYNVGTYIWDNIYYNNSYCSHKSVPAHISFGGYNIKGNKIYFDSICPDSSKLVLEYYSNGISISDTTYIEDDLKMALISYIRWQNELDKGGRNVSLFEKEYNRQAILLNNKTLREPLNELYKSIRKNVSVGYIRR